MQTYSPLIWAVTCSVLDKIKGNLRKEQRIVMEMNFAVMNQILSPLQVRHFYQCLFQAVPQAMCTYAS